jgi:hypothetical protein
MGIVDDIGRAARPVIVKSEKWPGAEFKVREISAGEAMAAGGVTERVLGALLSAVQGEDNARATKLAGQAAVEWMRHHETVACISVMAMRQTGEDGDEDAEWEPVRLVYARPDLDNPQPGVLWAGLLSQVDLQAIYAVAMGAASRAALGARPFRHPAGGEGEPGGAEAGRDGEALRDAPEPAPVPESDGDSEE